MSLSILINLLTSDAILMVILGTAIGIIIGAIPGLGAAIGIAVMLPFTYSMEPVSALVLLGYKYFPAVIGHKDKFDFIGKRLRRAFHFRIHVGARTRSRLVLENEPAATAQKHDCQHRNKAKAQPCPKRAWEGAGFGGRPVCLLELSCCWHVREVEFESCLL